MAEHGQEPERLAESEAIDDLVQRARWLQHTHERLLALLRATQLATSHVHLTPVLREIAVAASEIVGADCAALRVLGDDDGVPAMFVHAGLDDERAARIERSLERHDPLGSSITGPRDQDAFLAVPILLRGRSCGALYLADKKDGTEFTAADEDLAQALAGTAAVVIDHARLSAETRLRAAWQQAGLDVTAALLADADTGEVLDLITQRARTVAHADIGVVVLPTDDPAVLVVRATAGAADLVGTTLPADDPLCGFVMISGEPLLSTELPSSWNGAPAAGWAANAVVPLAVADQPPTGVLLVARTAGRAAFTRRDLDQLTAFGSHAALAQRLAEHRSRALHAQRLADRERIARDLHDHVIQELFATGLTLHAVAHTTGPDQRRQLQDAVKTIDRVIHDIRASIFELQITGSQEGLRQRLLDVVHDAARPLGFAPRVRLDGPLDTYVRGPLDNDVVAVVREALSNVIRHARATQVTVHVTATPTHITVRVEDDGAGIGDSTRRSGLANLHARADIHGGGFTVDSAPGRGTRLIWTVPLER